MALSPTKEDSSAWKTIGGAFDNLSDTSQWVIEGLKAVEQNRDPIIKNPSFGHRVTGADVAQKAYSYSRKAYDLLDEKTRQGAIIKISVDAALDIVGGLLGASLSTHPYYVYHKAMMEYLASAVDANRNAREAIAQFRKAVSAATSKALAETFKRLEARKVEISASYIDFKDTVGVAADIARGLLSEKMIQEKVKRFGVKKIGSSLIELQVWRMAWTGLAFEGVKLQVMAHNQVKAAQAAMAKVEDLVSGLMQGNYLNKVNGYGAQNHIEWEKYDLIVNQGKPQQAALDPVAFAQANFQKAQAWCQALTEMCDFARTTAAIFPSTYNQQLERLNKVLYA